MIEILSADAAMARIPSGAALVTDAFILMSLPQALFSALEKRFLTTGEPRDLSMIHSSGPGSGAGSGLDCLAHPGMLKRIMGSHWNLMPNLRAYIQEGRCIAHNLPQSVMTAMYRDIAAHRPTVSRDGLYSFVDPRFGGGKANAATTEEVVRLIELDGEEYLHFRQPETLDFALLRGTSADENGNIYMEEEALMMDALPVAQAVHNCGGTVIFQVKAVVKAGSIPPRLVRVPGILVDIVVVAEEPETSHRQTQGYFYHPALSGQERIALDGMAPMPFDIRKIIARRAAMELRRGCIVNLGIGMPEGVAAIAAEEGISEALTLTVESGVTGGVPLSGQDFGAAFNAEAMIPQSAQFDFYGGGGLDLAFLGLAECDRFGNVNVSRFPDRVVGQGGFINISQNAKKMVFVGTFTTQGLQAEIEDGKLRILREGSVSKFVRDVLEITFSGTYASRRRQPVLYVTERAVFELRESGLMLVEIAPGIDPKTQVLDLMDFEVAVSPALKEMDPRIFRPEKMGLTMAE